MDVPTSLKQEEKSTPRQEMGDKNSEKIDRMIRWMQSTGLVLQEFSQ